MAQCTAPKEGHRTASGAAACPACRGGYGRSYGRSYSAPSYPRYSGGGSGGSTPRSSGGGSTVSYTVAERATLAPLRREAEKQAEKHPERRDLFLCHAWPDREAAARTLYDLLRKQDVSVWFSEEDVGLGTSLLREIDKGLRMSRIGIVLVTPALLASLDADGIASRELSALLATDRVIPVVHDTTFDVLRDTSPLLGSRSGLSTENSSLDVVAIKLADTAKLRDADGLTTSRNW